MFLKRIKTLKEQQWDDIYKAAHATQDCRKLGDILAGEHEKQGSIGESSSEDDGELFDPLYDGTPSPSGSSRYVDSEEV